MESHISEIFSDDRRQAMRRKARLPVSVSVFDRDAPIARAQSPLSVLGYTRDLSANGLLLIVPSILPGEDETASVEHELRIILALPAGDVEMRVRLVRHERLKESEPEIGYLVGVTISDISESAHDLYLEYLRGLGGQGSGDRVS